MTVSGLTITRAWRQPGHRLRQDDPENPIRLPKRWPGPFPFQDSYLLSQGKDFCVKRCAAKDDFAEDGDEHVDDLVHAGKGIRWGCKIPRSLRQMR